MVASTCTTFKEAGKFKKLVEDAVVFVMKTKVIPGLIGGYDDLADCILTVC